MALDEDGRKAVAMLVENHRNLLQAPEKNKAQLHNILDDKGGDDLVRAQYAEVIEEAHRIVFRPGGAAAAASGPVESKSRGGSAPTREAFDDSKIEAPFRFVALSGDILAPGNDNILLNEASDGLFSGTIDVEWIAETPLLIGGAAGADADAPVEPVKIGGEDGYVLPGATTRGLVRSACEMAGLAKLARGNWHHRYGLRDFDHPYYVNDSGISVVEKVSAGFLTIREARDDDAEANIARNAPHYPKGDIWEIAPADWEHVPISTLTSEAGLRMPNKAWKENALLAKYAAAGMSDGRTSPDFSRTFNFIRKKVDRTDGREMVPSPTGEPGVFCFSGKLPGKDSNKKFEYALFRNAAAKPLPIPARAVEDFLRLHTTPSKNKREPAFSWKDLHGAAYEPAGVPVFMVGDLARGGDDFFFGLTRLFKIPHKLSVDGVVRQSHKAHLAKGRLSVPGKDGKRSLEGYEADMVENLFGYVIEPGDVDLYDQAALLTADGKAQSVAPGSVARRGRVAFGFAWLDAATPAEVTSPPVKVIQMAPRASFAPFYLAGETEKDYSGGNPSLAGRKAYLPRYPGPEANAALDAMRDMGQAQIQAVIDQSPARIYPTKVISDLKFLMPKGAPLRFRQTIRLHNVAPEEVGLLLFGLTHGGDHARDFRHMMGRARPFGAGQMKIGEVTLKLEANVSDGSLLKPADADEAYDKAKETGFAGPGGQSLAPFLDAFVTFARRLFPAYPEIDPVREWLGACSPAEAAKIGSDLRYRTNVQDFAKVRKMFKPLKDGGAKPPAGMRRLLPAPKASPPKR